MEVEHAVVTWKTIHEHGPLWWEHHKLRKRLFVDQKAWDIPHNSEGEWDQYDTPDTAYVITHKNGRPLAASRLNQCNVQHGHWTYMIRDACAGKLPGIPAEIMASPPTDASIWEATRFTVDPDLSPDERNEVLALNAKALADTARAFGASKLIALMPPAFVRWLTSLGLKTVRAGPTCRDGLNNRICVMEMPIP
jgi:N-acyl-L-homoserine lactone synthetase